MNGSDIVLRDKIITLAAENREVTLQLVSGDAIKVTQASYSEAHGDLLDCRTSDGHDAIVRIEAVVAVVISTFDQH
ncbi:hypothetical protein GRI97_07980 [Altererythrobacter xixiisoli]|uniref:Rho-binding antiterminator n=1 Tax=Croceibacterium xixiisoli TaxID=1476466 RepID=A0A6I4TSR9_9SPHN|nr:hypothetical protein [Croceibacterium xixiisoli]MXO98924.1 hypothetical protein [Croceibacterium xixiisoli]